MELTPGQLEMILELLEEELRRARRDALDDGASPAAVDAAIADRSRILTALTRRFVADDPEDAVDDAGEGGGVGQQR
jgi:hypothetical protein